MINKIINGILILGLIYIFYSLPPKEEVSKIGNGLPVVTQTEHTYFAEIDENDEVIRVIVADQEFIDSGLVGEPSNWIQTSKDGSLRKNYAGKGYKYDKNRNAFIPKKPTSDAIFNEETARWIVPQLEVIIDDSIATTT